MRRWMWLAGALLPVATGVQAQTGSVPVTSAQTPLDISVADRVRPDYAPIGGRIGSFFLYPRLDATAQYNSNLRATTVNQISDVTFDLRPSLDLQSQWTRNRLDFNIYYDQTLHGRYSTENTSQYGGSATGTFDAGRSTIFDFTATAARLTQARTDINSFNLNATRSPIRFSNLGLSGTVRHDFSRLNVIATGFLSKQSFDDAVLLDGTPLPQGYRDDVQVSGALEGRYLVGAGTRLLVRAERGSISYDQNPFGGYDRNSSNYRIEGGVSLEITRLIYGELRVGYYKQNNKDPRFLDSSGVSFSANVLYNPSALTSIRLYADRSIEPGSSVTTAGNVRSTVALTVDHELLPNLVVTGYGRYSKIEPQGPISDAQEYEERANLQYFLSRRFRFTLGAGHYSRRSTSFGSFDVTTGSAGVIVTL